MSAEIETLSDFVLDLRERHGAREGFFSIRRGGRKETWTPRQLVEDAFALALTLEKDGVRPGDRIALFSENRPEWHLVDFACQLLGAVSVPVFPNLPRDQVGYVLRDSGARLVFSSDPEKRDMVDELAGWAADPPRPVAFDVDARSASASASTLAEMLDRGHEQARSRNPEEMRGRVEPDAPASILYTSGTTGDPKGVVLTHRNLVSNLMATKEVYPGEGGPDEQAIGFLPLSHVFARTTSHLFLHLGIAFHYVGSVEEVPDAFAEVRPTVFASVPILFERAFARIRSMLDDSPATRRRIFEWALEVGRASTERRDRGEGLGAWLTVRKALAQLLVYGRIQKRFGGRLKLVVLGGAQLPREIEEFFFAIGVDLYQGYGLTETSPVLSVNTPESHRLGSVGRALPGVELRIGDEGEVQARGPGVMQEYWNRPAATAETFSPDGWFRTGDLGRLDDDGFLFLAGRIEDILVTADGLNVAPVPIEQLLTGAPIVARAVVVGDDRPCLAALLVPDFESLGIRPKDRPQKLADPDLQQQFAEVVETTNRFLASHERIREWRLVPQPFAVETGELTPTLEIRRSVVAELYAALIEEMYRERL